MSQKNNTQAINIDAIQNNQSNIQLSPLIQVNKIIIKRRKQNSNQKYMKHSSKQHLSHASSKQTIPYRTKQVIYHPLQHQPLTSTQAYNPIYQQISQVESRIVTQNNSSLVLGMNLNPNRFSVYQKELQGEMNAREENNFQRRTVVLGGHRQQNQVARPHSNMTSMTENNHSSVQASRNNQSSLNSKRPGSVTRGGIRVVSRNSSIQKKSSTSVDKSITSKDMNTNNYNNLMQINQQKNLALCGMNCTTRNPFTQNQQPNQVTVPHLGSLQTLTSHITEQQLLSQRTRANPSVQKPHPKFYQHISQRNHIQPPSNNNNNNNYSAIYDHSQLMKENLPNNNSTTNNNYHLDNTNMNKVYKQVRQMMQKQIQVAKKMYEKKFLDQIDQLNLCYRSQIDTLQRVLGENLTVIQEQEGKIAKLEERIFKRQTKMEKYNQRYDSLMGFIQKSNKFALQRIDQVQHKFILLLTQLQSSNPSLNPSISLQNKLSYLQQTFSSLITQTIIKYRSIQFQLKEQIKQMMRKYEYFEQKIYEMDLMKHLGKENQIQNYRLIQSIQGIREKMVILESRANLRGEVKDIREQQSIASGQLNSESTNLHKVQELKRILQGMTYKMSNLQNEQAQMSIKLFKLQGMKSQLQHKISALQQHITTINGQMFKLKQERDQLLEYNNQKKYSIQSPQKNYTHIQEVCFSSQKKSINNQAAFNQQNRNELSQQNIQLTKQLQRLHEIIDQYENKIQQLHLAVQRLQQENSSLATACQQKDSALITTLNQKSSSQQILNQTIHQKQHQLQQISQSLQQTLKQKQQLQSALQMTQQIFDQQISKFKQTIKTLQEENDQLLIQLDQLRQSHSHANQQLLESASSTTSNKMRNVLLAKSPKKQMCETVTMGWFKRNTTKQHQNINHHHYHHQQQLQQSPQQNDQFFYPHCQRNNNNTSTRQSINSTSIMQSHPNITSPSYNNTEKSSPSSNNYYYTHTHQQQSTKNNRNQKLQSPKTETLRKTLKHSTSMPENNYQFYQHQEQLDSEEAYIF